MSIINIYGLKPILFNYIKNKLSRIVYKILRYKESESNRLTTEQKKREVDLQAAQVEEQATNIEGDLKVEREWRISLQDAMLQDREKISKLQIEIGQLKIVAQVKTL